MKITEKRISIRDIVAGYVDDGEGGVRGYNGLLDIRPAFQREFVYKDAQRDAVLDTVSKQHPLNVFYWAVIHEVDDQGNSTERYEIIDGQQRTVSISQFANGDFSIAGVFTADGNHEEKKFHTLSQAERDRLLDYELTVYLCDGDEDEKLAWFRTINIAGEELTAQELRNAVYAGPWLADAKRLFSQTRCWAARLNDDGVLVKGTPIRQELLERALAWTARYEGKPSIEAYMAAHQHDHDAYELKRYYGDVIEWARAKFPRYRKEMASVDWARLFDEHGIRSDLDPVQLEVRVSTLMADEDVTKKPGVYEYVLTGKERLLSIRQFSDRDKRTAYERQQGVCPGCDEHFDISAMQGDHIVPWSKGGRTMPENCQMLCTECNSDKSDD